MKDSDADVCGCWAPNHAIALLVGRLTIWSHLGVYLSIFGYVLVKHEVRLGTLTVCKHTDRSRAVQSHLWDPLNNIPRCFHRPIFLSPSPWSTVLRLERLTNFLLPHRQEPSIYTSRVCGVRKFATFAANSHHNPSLDILHSY